MKGKKKQFAKDFLSYGLVESIGRIASIFLLPILTRTLSVEEFGSIDLIFVLTLLLANVFQLSLTISLSRFLRVHKGEKTPLYFTLTVFITLFSIVLMIPLIIFSDAIASVLVDDSRFSFYLEISILAAFFMALSNLSQLLLRRRRQIFLFGTMNIAYVFLYVGLSLLFVLQYDQGALGVFYGYLAANFLKYVMGLLFTWSDFVFRWDKEGLVSSLNLSLPFFPGSIANWANSQLNRLIILNILGLTAMGFFGAASRISNLINFSVQLFKKTWQPHAVELIQEKEDNEVFANMLIYYFGFYITLGVMFILVSPFLIDVMLPEVYFDVYTIVPWLAMGQIIHYSSSILNVGTIITLKTGVNARTSGIALISNVTGAIVLGYYFGILGVSISFMLSEILSRIYMISQTQKLVRIDFDTKLVAKLVLLYIFAALAFILYLHIYPFTPLHYLLVAITLCVLYFGVFYVLLKKKHSAFFEYFINLLSARFGKANS
ncbi:MAG: oligosaccharide flippase family protein [Cyclobacteriaceae bacterium]